MMPVVLYPRALKSKEITKLEVGRGLCIQVFQASCLPDHLPLSQHGGKLGVYWVTSPSSPGGDVIDRYKFMYV